MKLSRLVAPLFGIVAIVAATKPGHRVAPEKKFSLLTSPRAQATVVSPVTALGVVERDGRRYLVSDQGGPIAVPADTAPIVLFSFVRLGAGLGIESDLGPFSYALAPDPTNPNQALVVVAAEPAPPPDLRSDLAKSGGAPPP